MQLFGKIPIWEECPCEVPPSLHFSPGCQWQVRKLEGYRAMAWDGNVRPGLLLLLFSFTVISEAAAKALDWIDHLVDHKLCSTFKSKIKFVVGYGPRHHKCVEFAAKGIYGVVDGSSQKPTGEDEKKLNDWSQKDAAAMFTLTSPVDIKQITLIESCTTAKQIFLKLETGCSISAKI
ncbi:hypothetical protein NQ315_002626 [Exocentrus adspersus]|uniref:Uncharacterized protein n=1 Tax=Exocentrus adspersus TaxID=1586481 RepID=A0AAV8VVJ9_9CUCU|nr:hypothetical protein NQ315_002626 [Exocentrus adspersus]